MWDLIIFVVLIYVLVRLTILGSRYDEALEVATEVNQQYASGAEQEKFNVRLQRLEAELAELRGLSATASVVDRGGSPVTHVAREKIVTEVLPAEEDEGALDEFILPLHL